jgi:hypothetical protein
VIFIAKRIVSGQEYINLMQDKQFLITVLNSSRAQVLADLRIRSYRQSSSFSFFDETALDTLGGRQRKHQTITVVITPIFSDIFNKFCSQFTYHFPISFPQSFPQRRLR